MPTHAGAVLGRRPEREAAPAAADVEHPVALLQRQLAGDRLQLLFLGLLQGLAPRARRSRSCRSSTRRGRARRTRWRRRSGGAPPRRRAPCCGGVPLGRSSAAGRRRRPLSPAARTAPSSRRALVGALQRGRLPAVEQLDHGVHVVDLDLAADVGAAEAELSGRPQRVGGGPGRAHVEGRSVAVASPAAGVPSQNSTVNGRSGMRASISRRSGAVLEKAKAHRLYLSPDAAPYDRHRRWQAADLSHPIFSRSPTRRATASSPAW